jgi:hypothetical protein
VGIEPSDRLGNELLSVRPSIVAVTALGRADVERHDVEGDRKVGLWGRRLASKGGRRREEGCDQERVHPHGRRASVFGSILLLRHPTS